MSTPSLATVRARRDAAAAMTRWSRALQRLAREADQAVSGLDASDPANGEGYLYEAARMHTVCGMLQRVERDATEVANLWRQVAEAEARSRGAAAYLDALKDDGSNEAEAREAERAAIEECLK